ncbi:unnamed protein product, partial [Rotaria socialis]
ELDLDFKMGRFDSDVCKGNFLVVGIGSDGVSSIDNLNIRVPVTDILECRFRPKVISTLRIVLVVGVLGH